MDHIQALREIIKTTKEYKINIAMTFMDFEKNFYFIYPRAITDSMNFSYNQSVEKLYVQTQYAHTGCF